MDWQNTDESLVKHASSRQLGDDLRGLGAAWRWDVDLLGEFNVTILEGKEGIVAPHSNLQEVMHDENIDSVPPHQRQTEWAYMCSWVVSQEPLCRKDVPSMDKVTFSTNKKTDQVIIVNSGKMQNRIMQRLSFFLLILYN